MVLAAWLGLAAQAPAQRSGAPAESLGPALAATAESLATVRRAAAAFRGDLSGASPDLVLIKAGHVYQGCRGARGAAAALDSALAATAAVDRARAERDRLRRALSNLRLALQRCVTQQDPGPPAPPGAGPHLARADSLRAWGPYRLSVLEAAVRRYEVTAADFKNKAGLH